MASIKDERNKKTKNRKSDEEKGKTFTELQTFGKKKDDGALSVEGAEGISSNVKKRSSFWRRSFTRKGSSMFSRTPPSSNLRNDKVPVGKQSGGLLKKKAKDTILSVLTKKQTQEKQLFPERTDRPVSWGPELGVDPHSKTSRPYSVMVKSSTTFSSDRDISPADSALEEPEIVSVRTHPVYKVRAKVIDEEKVNSVDPKSTWADKHIRVDEKDGPSRKQQSSLSADRPEPDKIGPAGAPNQQKGEAVTRTTTQGSVTTSTVYNSSTVVKTKEPQSPKKEVNLSFQIPVDKQTVVGNSERERTSPVWASSVNVWVPFQVMGGNEAAPVSSHQLDSSTKRAAPTETEKNKDGSRGDREANSEVVCETVMTSSRDVEVKMAQTVSASSIGESNYRPPVTSTPVKASHGHTEIDIPPNPPGSGKVCTKSGSRERIFEPTMQSSQMFNTDLSPVGNHSEMPVEKRKKTASISELTFTIDEESPLNAGKDQVDRGHSNKPQANPEKKSKDQREFLDVTRTKPRSKSTSAADSSRQVSTLALESDGLKKIKPHKDSLMITRGKISDNSKGNSSTLPGSGRKLSNSVEALAGPRRKSLPAAADKMPANKRDKSPNDSPKPSRRFGTARDIIKSRSSAVNTAAAPSPSSSRKQRPQSDPLAGERIQPARKQSSSVFSKFSSGKSKSAEIEALKLQLKQFGDEKESLREKVVNLETQREIIPVLEKEKLVMERQMNDVVQEREKVKLELKDSNESLKKLESDVQQLTNQQQLHLEEIEKGQVEMDAILDEKLTLEKVKISLDNDNKHLRQQVDSHLENVQKITKEKDKILSETCMLKTKLKELLVELGDIRKSVIDLKEDNIKLRIETVENDLKVRKTLTCCVTTFQSLAHEVEKQNATQVQVCATSQTDNIVTSCADTQTDMESDNLSDKADITNEEYDDLLEELEDNKEEIEALQKKIKTFEENNELVEKFEDAELELKDLRRKRQRMEMSEETKEHSDLMDGLNCEECQKLREALESLQTVFCLQQSKMEKLSEENEILEMDRNDLEQESNYLKNVLSYRQDVQDAQTSLQQNKVKKVEQLESNLDDAESKVRELEDEVYRLHKEKQTLLMSILNLNDEDGTEDDGKESSERKESNTVTDIPCISEGSSLGISNNEYSLILRRTDIPIKTEPEGSELNNDGDAEIDVAPNNESKHLKDQIKKLQEENDLLKSSLANNTRDENFVEGTRTEIFEGENKAIEERINVEKNLWNAQLKAVEEENKNLKESLLRVEDENMALIKCLELGSAGNQTSSAHTSNAASPIVTSATEDEDREISRDASYIQSIVGKLRRLSMTSASEYESEIDKSGGEELEPGKRLAPEGSPPSSEKRPRDGNELARIVASLETDLGKLKKHMYKKDHDSGSIRRGSVKGPKGQVLRRNSTVHEINFAKTNLERVYREKRHLKDEVDSLRRCLNSSHHTRRRFSVVETHHATIKTFDDLLQKSDLELRESNAKIARLELMNADTEEKLREAEALGEDLRKAVVVSNNIATEEREKAEKLEEEKSALLALVQQLTLSRMGGSIEDGSDAERKHASNYDDDSDKDNYEISNPTEREMPKTVARDRNGNIVGRQMSTESAMSYQDYEDDRQSRHSSFADVSELDSDESLESEEESDEEEKTCPGERNGDCSDDDEYSTNNDSK